MPYRRTRKGITIDITVETGLATAAPGDVSPGVAAVEVLTARKAAWAALPAAQRRDLLEALLPRLARVASRWAEAAAVPEGLDPSSPLFGEEWLTGPALALRYLRHLERSLRETVRHGHPQLPGATRILPSGEVRAPVFPRDTWDRLFFPGVRGEALLSPDEPQWPSSSSAPRGSVCLVLGGGNVTAIPVLDTLGKLFVDDKVVLLKLHRLTPFLEPVLTEAFAPLIDAGYLRILPGGGGAGRDLAALPGVDEVHVTGSDRTYEAIMFGDGADGAARRAHGEPIFDKPVTAELGNVTPVIVVPGRWSAREIALQAEHVASMLTNNAGFNCAAARVVITPAGWPARAAFLDGIRAVLAATPTRRAWYPGAAELFADVVDAHPGAERFGASGDGHLPWAFLTGLDHARDDEPSFRSEAFCSAFAETPIPAESVAGYLDAAVRFANDGLWGTLAANVIVHPASVRAPADAAALERAIAELRFGTVAVNYWSSLGFGNGVSPWGAFPGSGSRDIQSGVGFTHNALMLRGVRKSIIRAPFRPWPKPPYFSSHRTLHRLGPDLARFESRPGLGVAARLAWWGLRG